MQWQSRITVGPQVCHGQACILGTRIPVNVILDNLAVGIARDEILKSYPTLSALDLDAAMSFAADLAKQRVVPLTGTHA
jgi:uncharacterized protein (DUF433 family)